MLAAAKVEKICSLYVFGRGGGRMQCFQEQMTSKSLEVLLQSCNMGI